MSSAFPVSRFPLKINDAKRETGNAKRET